MEEISYTNNENEEVIKLTPSLKMEFLSTAKWGRYIAITGFVSAVLLFIMGVSMLFMAVIEDSEEMLDAAIKGVSIFSAVFMWIIAGVCFALCLLLFKGCGKILNALNNNVQEDYLVGIHKVRIFTQIVTVLSIISVFLSLISTFSVLIVNIIK